MAKSKRYVLRKGDEQAPSVKARVFVEDPLTERQMGRKAGFHTLELAGETYLGAGPTSSRVQIVAGSKEIPFRKVKVLPDGSGFDVGRGKPENNLDFHRVNCWALVAHTLELLQSEKLLGRSIPWSFNGGRLKVKPHAGDAQNAFYNRDAGTLEFYYFDDPAGKRVFTCLSHDTVTHELGHAVLDGLKPYYWGGPSPEEGGFHEYFGDAVAMTSQLTLEPALREVAKGSKRLLGGDNLVAKIGREVGLAIFDKKDKDYARLAYNTMTMADLRGVYVPHKYSEVLTGAFYDLLRQIYAATLGRVKHKNGKRKLTLAQKMKALASAGRRTSRIMLRALDYCPPAGLDYADYARAVIRADQVAHPLDVLGYRKLARKVFLKRKIVRSLKQINEETHPWNMHFRHLDLDRLSASPNDAYHFLDANRELLNIPRKVNFSVTSIHRTRKISAGGYYPPRETVVEFVWPFSIPCEYAPDGKISVYGGGTMVFDSSGNVRHYVLKGDTPLRRKRLIAYWSDWAESGDDIAAFMPSMRTRSH